MKIQNEMNKLSWPYELMLRGHSGQLFSISKRIAIHLPRAVGRLYLAEGAKRELLLLPRASRNLRLAQSLATEHTGQQQSRKIFPEVSLWSIEGCISFCLLSSFFCGLGSFASTEIWSLYSLMGSTQKTPYMKEADILNTARKAPPTSSSTWPATKMLQLLSNNHPAGSPAKSIACDAPASAYVHLPFCKRRCFYCDFPIQAVGSDLQTAQVQNTMQQYVEVLCQEIAASPTIGSDGLKTIFFGGGTPSLIPPTLLATILEQLDDKMGWDSPSLFPAIAMVYEEHSHILPRERWGMAWSPEWFLSLPGWLPTRTPSAKETAAGYCTYWLA